MGNSRRGCGQGWARKGVVQHTCQALPHNLSRNWKLAKQSAYANRASRHLCLEAELLCDAAGPLQRPKPVLSSYPFRFDCYRLFRAFYIEIFK